MSANHGFAASSFTRYVPILDWFRRYQTAWLGADLIAGATVWGMLVPEKLAYAALAGLPPQAGLYAGLVALPLYAVFGTSRQLAVAGTAASAATLATAVLLQNPSSPAKYVALAAALVLLVGLIFVLASFLRLGFITQFISRPVMDGFIFGIAIFIAVSQLNKLFGVSKGTGDTVQRFSHVLTHLDQTNGYTLAVGLGALLLLLGLERVVPRIPAGLVALALGIGTSALFSLPSHGVAVVGTVPPGLPQISVPNVSLGDVAALLPNALGLALVIYSESLGAADAFASKHGYEVRPNQELFALGTSNLGSGLVGGSVSATAVSDAAGARTEVFGLTASALILITLVVLTPLFRDLPEAVLAALVLVAVSHLMKVGELRRYYVMARSEFWLGILALVGVITIGILQGLIIAVAISLLLLVYQTSQPRVSVLGKSPHRPTAYVDMKRHPESQAIPGLLIVRLDNPLYFANASPVRHRLLALLDQHKPPARALLWDLSSNDELDITSTEMLEELLTDLRQRKITPLLTHVHAPVRAMLDRAGLLQILEEEGIYPTDAAAVDAFVQDQSLAAGMNAHGNA